MKSLRFLDRRSGYSLASIGLLLGMVVPSLVPAFASAGTLNTRSIAMSTASADASGANYAITFTPSGASWKYLVIDWCSDSALIGASCSTTGLSGFDAKTGVTLDGGAAIGTPTLNGTNSTATHTEIDGSSASTSTSAFTITLKGVHNPTNAGTFYARIYTYDSTMGWTSVTALGTTADTGAVALSASDTIGVTAYVLETMTFCVSSENPDKNCSGHVSNPSMTIGETVGTVKALSSQAVSTGTAYAQLSTNAASGAIVSLKSDATGCGGLYLNGDTAKCNIPPQALVSGGGADVAQGTAGFGLEVGSSSTATGATGDEVTGDLSATNNYNSSRYYLDYASGDGSGITGPYGSAVFNSGSAPVSNKNIPLTFGASISNNTPAGKYGTKLNLIATGTY